MIESIIFQWQDHLKQSYKSISVQHRCSTKQTFGQFRITFNCFVNNQQHKIDIFAHTHFVYLKSQSSKILKKKLLNMLINNCAIENWCVPHTTDNLSQIRMQSWQIWQTYQNGQCCVICKNFHWSSWGTSATDKKKSLTVQLNSMPVGRGEYFLMVLHWKQYFQEV